MSDPIQLPHPFHELLAQHAMQMKATAESADSTDLIPTQLRLAREVRDLVEPMIENYVRVLRSWGDSWAVIAEHLGTSRQAAWERYHHLDGTPVRSVVVGPPPRGIPE